MEKEIKNLYKIMGWELPKRGFFSSKERQYRDDLNKKAARLRIYKDQLEIYYFDDIFEGDQILLVIENCLRSNITKCEAEFQKAQKSNMTKEDFKRIIDPVNRHEEIIKGIIDKASKKYQELWKIENECDEKRKKIRYLAKEIQSIIDTSMSAILESQTERMQFVRKQKESNPSFDETQSKSVEAQYQKLLEAFKAYQTKQRDVSDSMYKRAAPLDTYIQEFDATETSLRDAVDTYTNAAKQITQQNQKDVIDGIHQDLQQKAQAVLSVLSDVGPTIRQDFLFELQQNPLTSKKIIEAWDKKLAVFANCKKELNSYRTLIKTFPRMVPIQKCNAKLLEYETSLYRLDTEQLLTNIQSSITEADSDVDKNFDIEAEVQNLIDELKRLEEHIERLVTLQDFAGLEQLQELRLSVQDMTTQLSDTSIHINKALQKKAKDLHEKAKKENTKLDGTKKTVPPFKESLFAPIHGKTEFPKELIDKILKSTPREQKSQFEPFVLELKKMEGLEKSLEKATKKQKTQQVEYEKSLAKLTEAQKKIPELERKIAEYEAIKKAADKVTDPTRKKKYKAISEKAAKKIEIRKKEIAAIVKSTSKEKNKVDDCKLSLEQAEKETTKAQKNLEKSQFTASCKQIDVLMGAKVGASSALSLAQWNSMHKEWEEACTSAMANMDTLATKNNSNQIPGSEAFLDGLEKTIGSLKKGWESIVQRKAPLDNNVIVLLKQKITSMKELSLSTTTNAQASVTNPSLGTLKKVIKEEIARTKEIITDDNNIEDYNTRLTNSTTQEELMGLLDRIKKEQKQKQKAKETNINTLTIIIGQVEPLLEIALENSTSSKSKEMKRAVEDIRQEAKQYSPEYIKEVCTSQATFNTSKKLFEELLAKTMEFTTDPQEKMDDYKKVHADVKKLRKDFSKVKKAQKTFPEFYDSINKQLMNIQSSLDHGNIVDVKEKIIRTQTLISSLLRDYATFQNESQKLKELYGNCQTRYKKLAPSLKKHPVLSKKVQTDLKNITTKKSKIKTLGDLNTTFSALRKIKDKLVEMETNTKSIGTYEELLHKEAEHQKALKEAWATLKSNRERENKEIQAFTLDLEANSKSEKKRIESLKKQAKNSLKNGVKFGNAEDYEAAKNQLDVIPQILRLLKDNPDGVNASALKNLDKINESWREFKKKWNKEIMKAQTNIATSINKMSTDASAEDKPFLAAAQKSFEKEYSKKVDAINAHFFAEDFSDIITKIQANGTDIGKQQTKGIQLVQEKQTYLQGAAIQFIAQNPFSPISTKPFKKLLRKIEITFLTAMPK